MPTVRLSSTLDRLRGEIMTKMALLQFDPTVGDLEQNCRRLGALAAQAASAEALVAISTELAVCGYPPRDLLMERDFVERSMAAALNLEAPLPVLVGTPIPAEDDRTLPTNGVVRSGPAFASITGDDHGRIVAEKQLLPTYDVFDEARYFTPKNRSGLARSFGGFTLGVTVCEDAWQSAGMTPSAYTQDPIEHIAEWCRQGVDIDATVNLSASPFHSEKFTTHWRSPATPHRCSGTRSCSPTKSVETTTCCLTAEASWHGRTGVPLWRLHGKRVFFWLTSPRRRRVNGCRARPTMPCASVKPKRWCSKRGMTGPT